MTAHTGLNTYALRLPSGLFLASRSLSGTTSFRDDADLWLWTPEQADDKAAEVSAQRKIGQLTAVRAR